ncbi:MAG TPA: gamma-glutamyl-gamma-aminobutyrate hydrolase family protein [Gemmatimonadaceae bacterium]|nr:gamma-glutamyl-gamma-aminobutyrate hydrolase family protein [Gemmatimonadaceae bacterium]
MAAVRPVIGVTTQTLEEIPDELPRCWIMSQRYVRTLTQSGAVPWIVPLMDDPETLRAIYDRVDGIFLPGGVDIDPLSYHESRTSVCGRVDTDRDRTEIMLADWAMKDRKPILAVCRGAQLLSVAAGGTLYQDLDTEYPGAIKHDYFPKKGVSTRQDLVHSVDVVANTRLSRVLGTNTVLVNSMHHQGIKRLAPTLIANAFAPDGLIEGVESVADNFVLGVQWHPEDLADSEPKMRRLFDAFIEAAAGWRAGSRSKRVTAAARGS